MYYELYREPDTDRISTSSYSLVGRDLDQCIQFANGCNKSYANEHGLRYFAVEE
jgi:hypothetical protein